MVAVCMKICCLAPYLPGVQAVSAHSTTVSALSAVGAILAELAQNKYLVVDKPWTQGCLWLIQHGTHHHWGGQNYLGPPKVSSSIILTTSLPHRYLHRIGCLSVIYHWLSSSSVKKRGLKDFILCVYFKVVEIQCFLYLSCPHFVLVHNQVSTNNCFQDFQKFS